MRDIELAEQEFARLIEVCRKQGLNSWQILGIVLIICQDLYIKAEIEYKAKLVV